MSENNPNGIAIVGMAGRFPGAADLERFWENLTAGVESVTFFRAEELESAGVDPALLNDPAYVPARAVVDGAELFDAGLFGYTPREAEVMDPQHRLLLECAWEALEHAGYNPWRYEGLIGVYAGAGPNTYLLFNLAANREVLASVGHFQAILGNGGDYLTTRLSYKLGLRGPSLTVQTACSTSLVAVHLAVQSLLNGECDIGLAGGVRLTVPRPAGYLHQTDGILSPDGHCRPYDAAAQGTVDGEGVGIVVLKRLEDALNDGDHIHAVILGTAVNNDGGVRVGYTAPGVDGQAAVIAMAQAVAAVHPETIGLVEGHGTATPLGDPIEVAALRQVFEAATDRKRFCALGSVKANVGHLDTAAGVTSLIKATLALERGVIPPMPHFQRPNPRLELEDSPFFVNASPLPWPSGPEPRRAGVSSFGMGGTNAHAVLEEAPPIPPGDPSEPWQLLVLSAASEAALEAATDRLADHLARHPGLDLADVAFTLQVGRQELAHRRMLVCRSVAEAREALDMRKAASGFVAPDTEARARADLPGPGAGPAELETLGKLWLAGAEVDWPALHEGERRLRIPLPAYPFQRQRYWIGTDQPQQARQEPHELPRETVSREPRPLGTPYVPPRTELEKRVATLFEDLLGFAPVGASDRFFDMGGHSLLGLQLLSRVKSEFGAEIRLEWLFQASSVADLAELISVVEEENQATASPEAGTIPRIARDGDLPLSFAQERLWLLDRLDPGTPAFNLTESVGLTGALDVAVLGRALQNVVRRHEALRTAFVDRQGRPVQRILPAVEVPLGLVDLSALPEDRREPEAGRLAVRAGERRFDLSRPPLLAAEVYRLGRDHHAVVLVLHHIVGDGWSSSVLLSDLTEMYRALKAGEPPRLPELPIQYADFAGWQRTRVSGEEIARQLADWKERLAPPLPVLDLPTDRPRSAVRTFRGVSEILTLPPELAGRLRSLGSDQGATPFMVLLAGFSLLLSRWSGQEDLIVGSPMAGRDRRELEPLIGIFLNMLPLRVDLAGDPPFRALLDRVRETALAAYARQDVPIERLIAEVQPARDLSRSPLFQVLFNLQAFPHPAFDVPGLAIEALPLREMPSRFDLTIYAEELRGEGIVLDLVYNADLFDRATMAGLLSQFRHILDRAAAAPDVRLSRISLVTPEAAAVLPDPRAPLGTRQGAAVHERFFEQARRAPGRPAVVDARGTWTYGELAARAGELAGRLRALGVGPGDVVAVLAWRGAPLVQALLAVLDAGAAFLILDPAHPAPRREAALRQAAPRASIGIGAGGELTIQAEAGPVRFSAPEGLAYVAFTSGSTGEPKGILGTHGPLAHFCAWHADRFGLDENDRFSLLSGLSHDPLLRDVFTPLGLGALICIPEADDLGSPARLAGWMARSRVTVCHLTPAFGQLLADGGVALPDLRHVFFAGDVLTEGDVARLRAVAAGAACVNFYGTTETPQAMAWFDASGAGAWPARRVPVGRGIDGAQLLVLNAADGLAAPGELGEVCIRTPYLSAGYLGDEHLTAERYVANPFRDPIDPADRLYRTGDLGRYRPDGAVALSGRRDGQVQVRGFRVEPAEVEAALARHPSVREAAVLLHEPEGGRPVLTAWLTGGDGSRPRSGELREFLRTLLPDPMVPEAFVWLERLPLTPNGKLDRRALPDPARETPGEDRGFEEPATPIEEAVAAIWRDLLAIDRVGRHDNFFELGGHSLLGTRVVSRVSERFEVEIPLRVLFETPTVAGLARQIETISGGSHTREAPPLRPGLHPGPPPLSCAQERLWFLAQLAPESPAYNMSFAVRLTGTLDRAALAAALSEIRRRHETLRTTFRMDPAGRPVQVIHPAEPMTLPLLDLSGLPEKARLRETRRAAAETARIPFDLGRGPLLRTLLFRLAPDEHIALMATHHIAADAWSLTGVLVPELGALYAAFTQGRPSPLPEPPVQYADFAVWQRSWLQGAVLEEQAAYWRGTLAGASTLELPVDRPRRPIPSARGASRTWRLPAAETGRLRDLAHARGATLFMAVHAAFAVLLQRYTGQDDVVVGMPVANRTRSEIEGLIGFFVNTLVLRTDLSESLDFPAAIDRSRTAALGAYAHQDLPFERLVDELGLARDPHRPPLLRVLLQLQNAPGRALELPGLTLAPFPLDGATSRFELVTNVFEGPEGLRAVFTYDADLFEDATIARFGDHFGNLLATWTRDPGRPSSELGFLSEAERHQLVAEWNEGPARSRERRCLHQRFEEQVDRAPQAPAVSAGSDRLTYRELDERSNRLAHHLLALGVRPGDRIALVLDRSLDLVVSVLAVLKAGAAYVPLNPADPAERLAFLLEDSGAALLIGKEDIPAPRQVRLDTEQDAIARRSGSRPAVAADPALPAYVIYTSGSTGQPKGVFVSHANVDRLFTSTGPWFGFGPGDVWTLFHSYAFDFSVWELWGALLHGGRLVVVPYWESRSPEAFYRLLQEERVTVLNQTPSAFRQLLWAEEAILGDGSSSLALRWIVFGGEALEPASLAPWFDRHGDERPRLVNMYGITETTVHVTFRPVSRQDLGRGSVLGRPIPDLQVHVLDRQLRPQPIGVPGEICVAGSGLALGYLGRPDLTAERFLPHPEPGEPGARLYRSGDLARRLPDGDLEYLGRIDHQVKIRGFRIEPGEIAAALITHPGVRESVVLARQDRLVAYVVPSAGETLDLADLRAHLAGRLPDFMVPSAFVLLERLPLTANGKIDRRALPPPEAAGTASDRERVPPRTGLERFLAGQVRDVLGLPADTEIGVHDDFFELGGNSISGAIFIHRLQETLREIVHVVVVFDHPTVASLSDYVKKQHPGAARTIWGEGEEEETRPDPAVGPAEVEAMRRLIVPLRPSPEPEEPLNPPAVFVLSPPRSGSTLLRVMLGAHPDLFAPPELELLSFSTLEQRSAAFQGRNGFWREGLIRAVMEACRVSAAEAGRIVGESERQGWSTRRFYRELQGWIGGRMLVDKTPSYALDPEVLRRAEAEFSGARYLHLIRHPQASLHSFEEARLDQVFFRRPHPFSRRQLAELVWTVSHQNILDFLARVPRERWLRVRFEELVREPQSVLRRICGFLGVDYRPEMAEPYRAGAARMVDGPHAVSRMLGDVKFLAHGRVDPAAAERWREAGEIPLGAPAQEVAAQLGYLSAFERDVLVPLQAGSPDRRPLFCVHPVGGEVVAYRELARRLPGQTVHGLQSPSKPIENLREMAALYVETVRRAQPEGPYRLAGWSMGGVVAFEMARQLVERGERVELLALIDTVSPVLWKREEDLGLVAAFALDLARLSGAPVPEVDLSGYDEEGALSTVLRLGQEAGALAPGVELPELRRLFERFRVHRRALSAYEPLPYSGEAVLFRARERRADDPALGWRGLAATLTVREVPGDHYTILREHGDVLAEDLHERLGSGEVELAPASLAQQRLWFLHRLDPASAAYNLPFAVSLSGPLDPGALSRVLTEVVRRHEPLRTTFREIAGKPVQAIAGAAPVVLPVVDLSTLPPERRRAAALRLAAAEAARPFDLARGPLFRPLLLREAADRHLVALTQHHIVTDGWSMGLLLREVGALYPALAVGLPSPLPALRTRYADFATRQRRWLEGPEPAALLDWWKERLAGAPVLELPTDRPRPAARRGRGAMEAFILPSEVVVPLRELARVGGATLYMGLFAAFQILLHRYTRQDDLVVGSPVSGRGSPQVQELIGFFVDAVALRGRVDGSESFHELLERTRGICLAAWAHQDLPFDRLVEEIQPERSLNRSPLFQVVLSLEERPAPTRLQSLETEPLVIPTGASKFDLTLMLAEREGRIDGFAEHDTDLFDATTLRRLLGHFRNLIAGAAVDPSRSVTELPMLDPVERHQLALESGAREEVPGGPRLHDLFFAQAERRPDAVALSFPEGTLTYGELARRARALAARLRGLGVGPEVPVALRFEREPAMVVAILGVLAAGGTYVPLDPAWPEDRTGFVLEDSGARIVLGPEDLDLSGPPLPAAGTAGGDNAAYVIYTSGSTGRPKGVAVTHRNVTRLLAATRPWFRFGEGDVWTLFHSYAFDFSVWEIWGALAFGGRLVIVPWETSRSPEAFAGLLDREEVTVLNQTPSAFYGLVDLERRTGRTVGASLSWVLFGGEALDAARLASWWDRHPPDRPRLANLYGITETTVHVTFRPVGPEDTWSGTGSAVGRPIPDLSARVLGPGFEPVPLGVPGELHVGGAGLARGYLCRPDLTAERFVPDPFSAEPGARLYRTGDLARVRPFGELEYLGRVDRQVKVRGFRIEPGEIEAALARHPAVAEAAVVLRDDLPGGRGLAAFWVAAAAGPGTPELRAFLKERLPEALVPAAFVLLDRLPVTPNGKVDRRSLESRPLSGVREEPSEPPRTPAEELLAGLWSELLGRERVGRNDDFFALGGHSLLATQLVSRVRETLGVEVPLRTVFETPTLAALAAAIPGRGEEEAAPPIVPVPRDGDLPLSFAQQRLWFLDRLVPGNPFYVMAFGLRLEGPLDVLALRLALREAVRRHESLRTTFHTVEGEPRQRVAERMDPGLPVIDLSGLEPERRQAGLRALARTEARRPFDLRRGPLLRGFLARLGAGDHGLLLHLHHIVADGWSMGVLRRELSVLYEAFAAGRPSPLPDLPIQYPDFAAWQRRWLAGEALERQLAYWRRQLDGAPLVLDLPFDRPRPAVESFRGGVVSFQVPETLVRRVRELGRGLGATLSMTALATYDLLLSRYTGRDDVVVGSAVANRNRRETEGLIGFFVNILVLRTRLSGDPTFAELAARVRETSLDAYAHQDLPFEKLVEELQLPRDLSHHPLCQVMYGFQNFPRHETVVQGLTFSPLAGETTDTGTAKADVTLFLAEEGNGLLGWIEYNADLFEAATVLRLGQHLTRLLEAAAEAPDRPVRELSLLSAAERHQLVLEWSAAGPEPGPAPLLPERIAAWARATPEAPALVSDQGALSYSDLLGRTRRLADRLRREGVGPEVRVGICCERPDARVEALLGVAFAGGAWVPLDPSHPPARLAFLIEDAGCGLVVTESAMLSRLPACSRLLLLDGDAGEGDLNPLPRLLPEHCAYVIYTSGSTGQPKGVVVPHGALARTTDALIRAYGVGPGDRVLQMLSPGFDVFVSEVATALGSGAALHVASREERLPGPPLAALLRERGITVLNFIPSMLAALEPSGVPALRTLILGGEPCPPDLAARWAPGRRIFTAYGPTETTVTCATGRTGARPDLGSPLEGARLHLLDGDLEPVPIGVPGEIFIGGEGLARGYLGRRDLTAGSFLPDPFGPPGSRLYRTGDLARRLPDGRLEFLGRRDDQVKLRGFRVEPGEAEARLSAHPEVESAVVAVRGDSLVAWIVPKRSDRARDREEQVKTWLGLYDEIYGREPGAEDPDADLVGWNSSFTGEPIPAPEMREWVEATAAEILELRPRRVLEIGCGTGLILRRVAPVCSLYVGTDFSQAALDRLGGRIDLPQVRLERRTADDFAGLPEQGFDTVILNSVVQYFPGVDYLVEVLEKAVAATADGGSVFLGDVRSLPLAEAFYRAVELHGDPSLSPGAADALRDRVAARRREEPELLVAPGLFEALSRKLPRIRGVEVRPKRGRADNELNRYRCQVVLSVGEPLAGLAPSPIPQEAPWSRWANDPLLGRLARRLIPELRAWARETLPEILVPSAFVVLDGLPRTPSGKVDRRALPAPSSLPDLESGAPAEPRTPVERGVAEVFRSLLGRERLGVETGFFEAGGHSLLATQAVSRLRERFGVELPLREVFEAPTAAGLARRIEALLAARRAVEAPPIRPVPRRGPLPLSFAQERLWFLDQLDTGRSPYSLSTAVRFQGDLDLKALKASLGEVVRRHEALRTTFVIAGSRPVQRIAPSLRIGMPVLDLSGLPEDRREAELARWIDEESRWPFDLAAGPLVRALALRLGAEDHAVVVTLHHIVSDGWSMGVLIRELGAVYEAFAAGRPSPLPGLPIQYADFAVWQRSWLQGEVLERQLGYWRERLAGAPPVLDLPLDRPRPPVHTFQGRYRRSELSPAAMEALSALGRGTGATLFMTLLAAWNALLFRVTGETDVLVGTPVANRNRAETEGLIGFFVNTLVMRTDLRGGPRFLTVLERVREAALEAYAHQDLPFERLVEELAPERSLRHSPLFQVMFAFEAEPPRPPDLPGLLLTPLDAESRTVKFDLTLLARGSGDGLALALGYNSDLFHATTAERLLGQLRTLIEGAAVDPGCPVDALPLLSEAQRHQLLVDWNDTAEEVKPLPLHRLFEDRAARHPDRIAVVAADERLTYGELDDRADRLARRLRRAGVGPESRVAILLDRSPAWVAAVLGVLKAGGAWVPLDPGLPQDRLSFLLADSGALLVLTRERLDDPEGDDDGAALPEVEVSPDHLAYVIYTSGSTGVPKGVAVTHRGLASLARAQADLLGQDADDRVLQFSSPSFDASVWELILAWQSGAELHLAPRESLLPGASLADLLRERGITSVLLPPTALSVTPLGDFPHLRSLVVGGEACPPELAERWSQGRRVVNAYGPTEATVCATAGPYEPGSLRMTAGRPLANARVLLLDPRGVEPVAHGVTGEVCLSGPGLARGYLGRPELTAERFAPDPWSGVPGSRLYRTGDLGRWLVDGRLELLGRIDEQVKVRGFRVEPGEVRAALLAHPAVREADVTAPAGPQGERRLVAWVAAGLDSPSAALELRRWLEARLPDWLVPSRIVLLDALPKTPGGKVDRRALPSPDESAWPVGAGQPGRRREPANDLERLLLQAWQEVLGLRSIGVEENFFDLGGTSLQGAILTNLLQERLGQPVYPVALFDAPTIAELALHLERQRPASPGQGFSSLVPLRAGGPEPPLFLVHPLGGDAQCYRELSSLLDDDRPVYGLQGLGLRPGEKPHETIEAMAAHYVSEIRRLTPAGPYSLGGWSLGGVIAFEIARRLAKDGERVELLALLDPVAPGALEMDYDDTDILLGLAWELGNQAGNNLNVTADELRGLNGHEGVVHLLQRAQDAGALPAGFGVDQAARLWRIMSASARAIQSYRPEIYGGRAVVFVAKQSEREGVGPDLGWGRLVTGGVDVVELEARHATLLRGPALQTIADVLKAELRVQVPG